MSPYADAAWEHEFAGTARTTLRHYDWSLSSSSLRGNSVVPGLGRVFAPASCPLRVDWGWRLPPACGTALWGMPA